MLTRIYKTTMVQKALAALLLISMLFMGMETGMITVNAEGFLLDEDFEYVGTLPADYLPTGFTKSGTTGNGDTLTQKVITDNGNNILKYQLADTDTANSQTFRITYSFDNVQQSGDVLVFETRMRAIDRTGRFCIRFGEKDSGVANSLLELNFPANNARLQANGTNLTIDSSNNLIPAGEAWVSFKAVITLDEDSAYKGSLGIYINGNPINESIIFNPNATAVNIGKIDFIFTNNAGNRDFEFDDMKFYREIPDEPSICDCVDCVCVECDSCNECDGCECGGSNEPGGLIFGDDFETTVEGALPSSFQIATSISDGANITRAVSVDKFQPHNKVLRFDIGDPNSVNTANVRITRTFNDFTVTPPKQGDVFTFEMRVKPAQNDKTFFMRFSDDSGSGAGNTMLQLEFTDGNLRTNTTWLNSETYSTTNTNLCSYNADEWIHIKGVVNLTLSDKMGTIKFYINGVQVQSGREFFFNRKTSTVAEPLYDAYLARLNLMIGTNDSGSRTFAFDDIKFYVGDVDPSTEDISILQYKILKVEEPSETDITLTGLEKGNIAADVQFKNNTAEPKSAYVIFALYDGDELTNVTFNEEEAAANGMKTVRAQMSITEDIGDKYAKIFVWDGLDEIVPLIAPVYFKDVGLEAR